MEMMKLLNKLDMYTKEFISNIGTKNYIESRNKISFSPNEITNYLTLFLDYKKQNIILNSNFDDKIWKLVNSNNRTITIPFNIDGFELHRQPLRIYTLLELKQETSHHTIQGKISFINQAIIACKGLNNSDCYFQLKELLTSKPPSTIFKNAPALAKYLILLGYSENDNLVNLCLQLSFGYKNTVRELPNFKDVLTFDWIIKDFYEKATLEEKKIFYPIILWWNITLIIPMRIKEFVSLAKDCAKEINGRFTLTIPREKKQRRQTHDIEITDTLFINYDTYKLIQNYSDITKDNPDDEFLLSYYHYCQSKQHLKSNAFTNKINKSKFEEGQFLSLLNNFFKEVVENKYKLSLQRIKPLDTRHYAFCNMMFQGFNMLTIARIGGHSRLNSQMHYFNHLEYFSQSSIHYLADQYQKIPSMLFNEDSISNDQIIKHLYAKSILQEVPNSTLNELPKMEYGYCTYNPKKCPVGDCRYCEHLYIPHNEFNDDLYKWLSNESELLWRKIKEQLLLFKSVTQNMHYNFESLEYDMLAQADLTYITKNIKNMQEQKARIDAQLGTITDYLFGGHNNEWENR